MTYALTRLVDRWGWRVQYERDAPLDRSGIKQIYADTLATGRFQAAEDLSWCCRNRIRDGRRMDVVRGPVVTRPALENTK